MQLLFASHKELFDAKAKMNEECRQLQHDIQLKDAQIPSLEEARKKDEGDNFRCLISPVFLLLFPTSTLVCFFHTVELLDAAQDILKNSTDLQAIINEAADLAKEVMELKKAHAKELEERDWAHASEVRKLSG